MDDRKQAGPVRRFFRTLFVMLTGYLALVGLGVTIIGTLLAILLYQQIEKGGATLSTGQMPTKKPPLEHAVLKITLDRPISSESPDQRQILLGQLFNETLPIGLDELQLALRRAVDDVRIHAVMLEIDETAAGLSTLTALRRSLDQLAVQKKPLYVHLNSADTNFYYLASAAQKISLSPVGGLTLPGPAFQLTYFGSALEKLGVQFEVVRAGKYKSAMESFVQDQPSPETLEMYQSLEGSLRGTMVEAIAVGRKRSSDEVRSWLKRSFFTSQQALAQGLVDRVGYLPEWEDAIKEETKALAFVKIEDYLEASEDLDKPKLATDKSTIALIEAKGEIVSTKGSTGGDGIAPAPLIEELRWAAKEEGVKAVVLRVDSPGGSALASDLIWDEVRKLSEAKPLVVSMGSVAASGGYYISAPAQLIVAEPTTITGSIGVIGAIPKGLKIAEKWGVNFHMVTGSDRKDYLNFGAKSSVEDKAILGESIKDTYDTFVSKVAKGRKQDPQRIYQIAEGRVYTGAEALKLGLVDRLGGLREALQSAKELGKLDADKLYSIVRYEPKAQNIFDCLAESHPWQCLGQLKSSLVVAGMGHLGAAKVIEPLEKLDRLLKQDRVLAYWPGALSNEVLY